jgi:hypothetical protein
MQSYFPERDILTTRKSIEENDVIALIINQINKSGGMSTYDLNKGIKELWKLDYVDAIELQYLKSKSTSKEVMHEEYTFKNQYPDEYKKAILAPIIKASFKFLDNSDDYCNHFAIEP